MQMWARHALHHRRLFWFYRGWVAEGYKPRRSAEECRWHRRHAWLSIRDARRARARITTEHEREAA
jgi:hypothetical protein